MGRFLAWLQVPVPPERRVQFVARTVLLMILWNAIVLFWASFYVDLRWVAQGQLTYVLHLGVLKFSTAILKEEVIFRLIPLGIAILYSRVSYLTLFMLAMSSMLFGFVHGSWANVFLQGVDGVCLAIVFIKCGAAQNQLMRGLFWSTAAHLLFNGIVITFSALW
jgi:hypothetical protein